MKNTYILTKPLSLDIEETLFTIVDSCHRLNIPFFIAGATAREIVLHHVYGLRSGRRTRDIDIAVYVDSWAMFEALKQDLISRNCIEDKNSTHRLMFKGIAVDIIPFGKLAENNNISWPPEHVIIMSTEGFVEAWDSSITVVLSNQSTVSFCSLPGLVLLKLFAWRDRRRSSKKDATDIYHIISQYGNLEDERMYDSHLGERLLWDINRVGAFLLGKDVRHLIKESEIDAIVKTFSEQIREMLVDDILQPMLFERDNFQAIEIVMNDFWDGFHHIET